MNTLKLTLLLCLISFSAMSQVGQIQQIKIVNFTVQHQMPSVIDNWNNAQGSLLLVAQKPPTIRVEGVRLALQIRSNGAVICGSNASNGLPVDNFTTRTFNVNELTGILTGCHDLKDGSYTICAQFFNIDHVAISNEVCKEFTVETPKETDYSPPTLINPENGKEFSLTDMQKPLMFRWTTLVPKPREPITYRLKVWQLMEGQSGTQAMRTNQPIVTKDVDNITQAVVNNLWTGPCKPPYLCDYIWSVQALNREGKPMGRNEGTSEPYTFKVVEKTPGLVTYAPPKLVAPTDGKSFAPKDISGPVTFRWTPVVPKPQEPITYRMKVWQLMQGQSGSQAMKTNPPIITRDVADITEATVSNIYTGPCRPPYLCDYVWMVQALDREGHPVGSNDGQSEMWSFSVMTQYIIQLDSLKVSCTSNPKQYAFSYIITNLNNSVAEFQNISVYSSSPAGATILSYAPVLGTTIAASGGTLTVTGIINSTLPLVNICIKTKIQKQGDPGKNAEDYLCDSVKACKCNACDSVKIDVVTKDIQFDANGNINLGTTISASPKLVKNIKAELVYFEYRPESDDCMMCNKDSRTFGNFANGTHSQEWNFTPPKNLSGGIPAAMSITVPPTVKCCNANIRWCIRYVVTFDDCTVCNKLVCYEKKKEGCAKGNAVPDNNNNPK